MEDLTYEEKIRWREIRQSATDVIMFLIKQILPFRGLCEDSTSRNWSNLEILKLVVL